MKFTRAGLILNTENYQECVHFYGTILGLECMFKFDRKGEKLTTFNMGGVYLMIETGGTAQAAGKSEATCPTKLRFNVSDIQATCADLRQKGLQATVIDHTWGTTAEFFDPDGNRCALRSDKGFGQ